MTFCINSGCGKAIVIDFERNGEAHRAIRWTSDVEFLNSLLENLDYQTELRRRFELTGAVVLSISAVKMQSIAIS